MNADIRIFPASELSDLDMAELMDAALIDNGVLQGCELSVNGNELLIASGRLIIKGRLAVVTSGQIERPNGVLSRQTCHVCAVCDLNADPPFTIVNLRQGDYDTLVSRAAGYSDTEFNVGSGVAIFELGTSVVDPTVGVVSVAPVTANSGKNLPRLDAKIATVNQRIDDSNTEIEKVKANGTTSTSLASLNSWVNYLKKRSHKVTKFISETKQVAGITVAAGGVTTVRFRKERGSKTYVMSGGGGSAVIDNTIAELWIKPDGTVIDQHGASGTGYIEAKDSYGVPTTINNIDWTAFGILGVGVSGTNANNCVVNAFGISGNYAYVRLRNIGSAKATLTVAIRVLQICEE